MACFVPNTDADIREMLSTIGEDGLDGLMRDIPSEVRLRGGLKLPDGRTQAEVLAEMEALSEKNTCFKTVFRGAGAYRHFIPPVVGSLVSKGEFVTAYTPYQAEISQGLLQAIFEYQTMICELTGMDVSNASVYDGATAACEGVFMCAGGKRKTLLVPECISPQTLRVLRGYMDSYGFALRVFPHTDGRIDAESFGGMMEDVFAVYFEQPNFFGQVEDAKTVCETAHKAGAKVVMGVNPIAAALFVPPGELGADVAVGEGQPLGLPLSFGGPYLGFMACKNALMRALPGRIVGQTEDMDGRRAYVLTLQAREQHIKRERAASNICSNEAHCALTAAAYLSAMGREGLAETARSCIANAHYLAEKITRIDGFDLSYTGFYFHEFVTSCPVETGRVLRALEERGILGGLPLGKNRILWCATEMNTVSEMDEAARILAKEVRP